MKFGSLFSGIGGLDLGLERAGMTCAWQVEIDDYCRRVLAKHWPDVPRFADVRTLAASDLEPVDLICGGFPCQPFSRAGRRLGIGDERHLWPHFARLIRDLQPGWVLGENVTGILTDAAVGEVLGDLAACGYDAEWDCIPAAAVGAPHIRDRFYLVAYPGERRPVPPGQTVFAGWTLTQLHAGWSTEPAVARVVDGPPRQMDRTRRRVLGAAVVPQVAEFIGRRIMGAAA